MTEKRQGRGQHHVSVLKRFRLTKVSVKREFTVLKMEIHQYSCLTLLKTCCTGHKRCLNLVWLRTSRKEDVENVVPTFSSLAVLLKGKSLKTIYFGLFTS